MHIAIVVLLAFVAVLQGAILSHMLCMRSRLTRQEAKPLCAEKQATLQKVFDVQGRLTSMQWNVDMVLEGKKGDFGKPNLAQKEFLHQVSDDCRTVAAELSDVLDDLGCSPTSKVLKAKQGA